MSSNKKMTMSDQAKANVQSKCMSNSDERGLGGVSDVTNELDSQYRLDASLEMDLSKDDKLRLTEGAIEDGSSQSCSILTMDLQHRDSTSTRKMEPPSMIVSFTRSNSSDDAEDSTSVFEDDYNAGMYHGLRGRRYCLSTLRFFGLTIILWCLQFVVSSSFGVLEGEDSMKVMNPSVMAQRVIPQLQENWNSILNQTSNPLAATYYTRQSQRPGYQLVQQGAKAHYPVVMIPGFVTSGLEVWTAKECAKKYFRQRIWTKLDMTRALLSDRHCWREHLALDPKTGLDPDQIKLRASEGFEAADYFMANYWVWEKLLMNLADLGYTPSTMSIEPYDWRMAFPLLEERDGYMTKLKYKIEAMHKSTGKKVVLTSHSMGGQLVHFFFKWVTTPKREGGGGGGRKWVDQHIHAYTNIAGSHLGVPKAASALMSGEMSDTIVLGTMGTLVEQFLGRKVRKDLWNTWGSLWGMLPKGGENIWDIGVDVCDGATDLDDPFCGNKVAGGEKEDAPIPLMLIRGSGDSSSSDDSKDECDVDDMDRCDDDDIFFDIPEDDASLKASVNSFAQNERPHSGAVISFLRDWGAGLGSALKYSSLYSNYGNMKTKRDNKAKVEWLDSTITPLPYAPNLKIYCMYGVGVDTERNYFYKVNSEEASKGDPLSTPNGPDVELPFVLDTSVNDPDRKIQHGIRFTDGDGSVPLLSLGYICGDAWTREDSGLNPSGTKVVTLEYQHQVEFTPDDPFRGGPRSADHVDILGNLGMTEDFLRVVSDFEPKTESNILSKLREYAEAINAHPRGGIFRENKGLFEWIKHQGNTKKGRKAGRTSREQPKGSVLL